MANKFTQAFAFVALFWIIISVIWTGLLMFFWNSNVNVEEERVITQEELQKIISEQKIEVTDLETTK